MKRDSILNAALIVALVIVFLVVLAMLVGLGFEAVKWLGHTQK